MERDQILWSIPLLRSVLAPTHLLKTFLWTYKKLWIICEAYLTNKQNCNRTNAINTWELSPLLHFQWTCQVMHMMQHWWMLVVLHVLVKLFIDGNRSVMNMCCIVMITKSCCQSTRPKVSHSNCERLVRERNLFAAQIQWHHLNLPYRNKRSVFVQPKENKISKLGRDCKAGTNQ